MGALESKIGTVIDGKKYRQEDGPVSLRDGSTLAVGKYILYCEIDKAEALQDRRRRISAGENFWKIINAGATSKQDAKKTDIAESGGGDSKEEAEAGVSGAEDNVPTDMDAAMEALSALIGDEDEKDDEQDDEIKDGECVAADLVVKQKSGGDCADLEMAEP